MQVREIMTENVACCTADAKLGDVARMMVEHDCGAIPVVENMHGMRPVGMVTDRDIVCRTMAKGQNPMTMMAREVMSSPVVSVTPDMSVEACCDVMEDNQVRRVPVVDDRGGCVGIVAQADVALNAAGQKTAEVVREVSQPV